MTKEDGKIDWKNPAKVIERQIRAFDPWPGSYCFWVKNDKKLRIKVLEAGVLEQRSHGPFGTEGKTFMASNSEIAVQSGENFLIIKKLQLEGGKAISSEEFLNGRPDFIGTVLE